MKTLLLSSNEIKGNLLPLLHAKPTADFVQISQTRIYRLILNVLSFKKVNIVGFFVRYLLTRKMAAGKEA